MKTPKLQSTFLLLWFVSYCVATPLSDTTILTKQLTAITKTIRTQKYTGPQFLQGIDFSDHLNYWKFGYSALMITDTIFLPKQKLS